MSFYKNYHVADFNNYWRDPSIPSYEKLQQAARHETWPLCAVFYDRETDEYFDGNGDEL